MEQTSPIQALLQQRTLLQLEYYTEKEAFRKLTEQIGMRRKVKRGDAWFPLRIGKGFYNSLNQKSIEVFRTSDEEIDHNFEFGRPVMFFQVKNHPGKFLPMLHLKTQRLRLKVQRLPLLLPIPRALNIFPLPVRSAMWMVTEW